MKQKILEIVSPSGNSDPNTVHTAANRLSRWGWDVRLAAHALGRCGRFAAPEVDRLNDLTKALLSPENELVLCARGGYGLQPIMDRLCEVVSSLSSCPTVVGFSDITALHCLLTLYGFPSLHAAMCSHLAAWEDDSPSARLWRNATERNAIQYTFPTVSTSRLGEADGIVIGGNLSVLYGLQGTPYGLEAILHRLSEPPLLFIEDIGENHYHIDRMLQNFRLSGVFQRIAGLIIGQWTHIEEDPLMGCTLQETVLHAVQQENFPVFFGFPSGHEAEMVPFWLGKKAHIEVGKQQSTFDQIARCV